VEKTVALGLCQHAPAYSVGRCFKRDAVLEVNGDKVLLQKGTQLNPCPVFAGQQAHPRGSFDIDDVTEDDLRLPHQPFGGGKHLCLGKGLALTEMRHFLVALLRNYKISTAISDESIQQVGLITLKLSQEITITLQPR
jgi:cytochrome P450